MSDAPRPRRISWRKVLLGILIGTVPVLLTLHFLLGWDLRVVFQTWSGSSGAGWVSGPPLQCGPGCVMDACILAHDHVATNCGNCGVAFPIATCRRLYCNRCAGSLDCCAGCGKRR